MEGLFYAVHLNQSKVCKLCGNNLGLGTHSLVTMFAMMCSFGNEIKKMIFWFWKAAKILNDLVHTFIVVMNELP